ncbi:MAG: NAD(P)-dependent oxidoreductase [Crenarchaeota archaeon]|nr:NAD(P)-dependent oxidoreductase [Thermoproteota archaeon]
MQILITGAFGNIGKTVIEEANRRNHEVIVFEVDNKKTRKEAQKYKKIVKNVVFGDIRNFEDVKKAVKQSQAVIHLAAIIPPASKRNRELTLDINYAGTVNLIKAIKEVDPNIALIFTSSASVMGPTQHKNPPIRSADPLIITGNYEESKIKCEEFLRKEADNYLIFRLAGVLQTFSLFSLSSSFSLLEELFEMHPNMRLEMMLAQDVALALITGAEKLKTATTPKNQAYILGGGKENGWQLTGKEFLSRLFGALSIPLPDEKYFTKNINNYHLDWYDTKVAQQEFNFQNHTFNDYIKKINKTFRLFKVPIKIFGKIILKKLVKMSPYQ